MGKPCCIYALVDPITNTVRYVGQSIEPRKRLSAHIRDAKRTRAAGHQETRKAKWILDLLSKRLRPLLKIEQENVADPNAAELACIKSYRLDGADLFNLAESPYSPNASLALLGRKRPDAVITAKLMAAANRGKKMETLSEEGRETRRRSGRMQMANLRARFQEKVASVSQKNTANMKRIWAERKAAGFKGFSYSEETRAGMSRRGKILAESAKGRPCSDSTKRKLSESMRRIQGTPDSRARVSAQTKERMSSPEERERLSVRAKRMWLDLQHRERVGSSMKSQWNALTSEQRTSRLRGILASNEARRKR